MTLDLLHQLVVQFIYDLCLRYIHIVLETEKIGVEFSPEVSLPRKHQELVHEKPNTQMGEMSETQRILKQNKSAKRKERGDKCGGK